MWTSSTVPSGSRRSAPSRTSTPWWSGTAKRGSSRTAWRMISALYPSRRSPAAYCPARSPPQTQFESYDDVRNWVPQLSRANIAGNQPIVDLLKQYAAMKNATPAQISLAWMLHKYPNVVPIPGSKNKGRIIENLDASEVILTEEEFSSLEAALNKCKVYGHRGLGGF